MQKALVHENIIQQLSKPHRLPHHQTVTVGSTLVMLRGYARSHYAALCFVHCVINDEGGLLSELSDVDAARLNTIQTRCDLCQSTDSLPRALFSNSSNDFSCMPRGTNEVLRHGFV